MRLATRLLPVIMMVVCAPGLRAQKALELGMDAEFDYRLNDPNVTALTLPNGSFRVGIPAGGGMVVEPRITFQYAHASGQSATAIELQLGILWALSSARPRGGAYIRPFVDYLHLGGGGSASQFALGGGVGVRLPQGDGRLGWRLEAGFQHSMENDNFASSDLIFGLLGISFFTH